LNSLDLFPLTKTISPQDGSLQIAGHSLGELARLWGTPLYLYDAATVRARAGELQRLLKAAYPGPSLVAYAAKAYFSPGFARHVAALGLGADVVSLGELTVARNAGFDPGLVHLHGNNKSAEEMEAALRWGVQSIVVDSLEELEFLDGLAARLGRTARIWLRVTPGLQVHTHPYRQTGHPASKFGFPLQDGQAAEGIRRALHSHWLHLTGLHTHLGSQVFEPEPYREAIQSLCQLAKEQDYIPEEFSPGGGWGVPYHPDDENVPAAAWVGEVGATLVEACQAHGWPLPRLVLEPGRWLSAQAGVAIYTIGTHKILADGTQVVAVDGGMADNPRPALYQARYQACLVDRPLEPPTRRVRLVGKFCESGDVLIPEVELPEGWQRGDRIVLPVVGAYQLSMASNYNLAPRPAVLWLEKADYNPCDNNPGEVQVLQRREDLDEANWWNTSMIESMP
jgi:diaminopimelate decarboxylase